MNTVQDLNLLRNTNIDTETSGNEMKCYNLENYTGEISLTAMFDMRMFLLDAVEQMQSQINDPSVGNPYEGIGASIEGNGFNIAFCIGGKEFLLRCALRDS
jgi:hypothetical protein